MATILLAAGTTYLVIRHGDKAPVKQVTTFVKKKVTSNSVLPAPTDLSDINYLDTPKSLSGLQLFKNTDAFGQDCTGYDTQTNQATGCTNSINLTDLQYYQIGSTSDGSKIITINTPGLTGERSVGTIYAINHSDGTYSLLAQMDYSPDTFKATYQGSTAASVNFDLTNKLSGITFPDTVNVVGQDLTRNEPMSSATLLVNGLASMRASVFGAVTDPASIHKIADKDGLSYYGVVTNDQDTFQVIEVYATFKTLFAISYKPSGTLVSADNLSINWTSGDSNSSSYFSGGQGCGSLGYVIGKSISVSDLSSVGTTGAGQAVYQLSTSSPLVQEIFTKDYDGGSNLDNNSLKNLTVQQITDKHAYFLAKNGFGEYVLYQREDMFIRGGCAKPVIYLYPQTDTNVSVKVGATITKSDPFYTNSGWQKVLAHPDGQLSYDGHSYSSLFWEGYGWGVYPDITDGVIVPTADSVQTVRSQLAQQGLKPGEVNDFINFWGQKLLAIKKPYVRLSWLNTQQMNELAPLNINPAPKTVIRVFLDFEGLGQPYNLPAQQFKAPKRTGFTVVEWGGLARQGLE